MYPMHQPMLVLCNDLGNKIKSATPSQGTLPSQQQHRHDKQTKVYLQQIQHILPIFLHCSRRHSQIPCCLHQSLWHFWTKRGKNLYLQPNEPFHNDDQHQSCLTAGTVKAFLTKMQILNCNKCAACKALPMLITS